MAANDNAADAPKLCEAVSRRAKSRRSLLSWSGMGHQKRQRRGISLSQYVRRRNGVSLGGSGSLKNMLQRSFGARSFAGFWRYWNPIFGYYLSRYVYSPTSRFAPRWLALLVTFLICGGLHDIVTFLFRGWTQFLFTLWFFFFSLGVMLSEKLGLNVVQLPLWLRAAIHLMYLSTCLILAISAQRLFLR